MRSVNKVILIGNVTRDPQVRQTGNGQSVCTFGLATNRRWVTSDGEQHNMAEFHELVAWSRLSDICEKYVRKGKLLYIEGYLKTRSWDTPEGVKKFKTEVIVQDLIMLEKRGDKGEYVPADDTTAKTDEPEEAPEEKEEEKAEEAKEETPEEEVKEEKEEEAKEEAPEEEVKEEKAEEKEEKSEEAEEEDDDKADVDMDLGL